MNEVPPGSTPWDMEETGNWRALLIYRSWILNTVNLTFLFKIKYGEVDSALFIRRMLLRTFWTEAYTKCIVCLRNDDVGRSFLLAWTGTLNASAPSSSPAKGSAIDASLRSLSNSVLLLYLLWLWYGIGCHIVKPHLSELEEYTLNIHTLGLIGLFLPL